MYTYEISGTSESGGLWSTTGQIKCVARGGFWQAVDKAHQDAFMQLMQGNAVAKDLGRCCDGPYTILKFSIERMADA